MGNCQNSPIDTEKPPQYRRNICSHHACTNRAEACGVCVFHGAPVTQNAIMLAITTSQYRVVYASNMVPMSLSRDANEKGCTNQVQGGGLCNDYTLRVKEKDATTMATPTNAGVYQRTVTDAPAQRYKQVKVQSYLGIKSCACFISLYLNYNL